MALSTHSLVLFAHILAGAVLVSSSLLAPLSRRAILAAVTLSDLRGALDLDRRSARVNPPAALLLLGSGIWLGRTVWWHEPWFWVAVGAWIVNCALAAGVIERSAGAALEAASAAGEGPVTGEVERRLRSRAWSLAAAALAANDVAILYVMVDKPGLAASLGSAVLANLVFGAAALLSGRAGGRRAAAASPAR